MLRTNNKKVKQYIENYIINKFHSDDYSGDINNLKEIKAYINNDINNRVWSGNQDYQYFKTRYQAFKHLAQGLGTHGICDYYYHDYYKMVDIVGDMLEQTQEQRNKYTNEQAAELMTQLIYQVITW